MFLSVKYVWLNLSWNTAFLETICFHRFKDTRPLLSSVSMTEKVQFILYAFVVIKHNLRCFKLQLLNFLLLPFVHFKCVASSILLVDIPKTFESKLFSLTIETILNWVISYFTKLHFYVYFTHKAPSEKILHIKLPVKKLSLDI